MTKVWFSLFNYNTYIMDQVKTKGYIRKATKHWALKQEYV